MNFLSKLGPILNHEYSNFVIYFLSIYFSSIHCPIHNDNCKLPKTAISDDKNIYENYVMDNHWLTFLTKSNKPLYPGNNRNSP